MGKLRIEKGASKVRRSPLKVTIDGAVADDLEQMCEWSENDLSYLVNLLLDFAITQSEEFQKYKAERVETQSPLPKDAGLPPERVLRGARPASDVAPRLEKGAAS